MPNEGGCIAVPPVPVCNHVGKNPSVIDEFLVADRCEYRNRESDTWETIEQIGVLDHRPSGVVQVLSLVDSGRVHFAIHTDHQIERESGVFAKFGQTPKDPVGDGFAICLVGFACKESLERGFRLGVDDRNFSRGESRR